MRRKKPMTISVELIVTIEDPADWTTAFGVEGRANIRQDVRSYVLHTIQAAGVFGNGEVAADIESKR